MTGELDPLGKRLYKRWMSALPAERRGGITASAADLTERIAHVLDAGRGSSVVWADCGDELVVHAGEVQVRMEADAVVVDVPVATEETGRAVLTVAILVDGPAGWGVTDERPWGPAGLADRWGKLLQEAVWAAVATLRGAAAAERGDA
jgi:hypothetical protein